MTENLADIFLPAGTLLNHGQYEIIKVLGHGGFGITYLAMDTRLLKNVAVKEYFPHGYVQRQPGGSTVQPYSGERHVFYAYGLERYIDEARTLAQFNHYPGIVSVYSFFEENATAYMVMEFLEGETVEAWLQRSGGQVDWDHALRVMKPVLETLELLHGQGIIHRDISPDNIYICSDGQVKMLDFGAARYALSEQSRSLSVILKQGYAPAEQYTSRGNQGPWTDVYAAAATIFRMVTGRTLPEAAERLEEDEVPALIASAAVIPDHCREFMNKALAVKSSERYQGIGAFKTALLGLKALNSPDQARLAHKVNQDPGNDSKDVRTVPDNAVARPSARTQDQAGSATVAQAGHGRGSTGAGAAHTVKASSKWMAGEQEGRSSRRRRTRNAALAGLLILLVLAGVIYMNRPAGDAEPANESAGTPRIGEDSCRDFAVDGEWLYYGSTSEGTRLYRIKNDGSGRQKLNDEESFNIVADGGWIYYASPLDQGFRVSRIKTDGSGRQSLFDGQLDSMVLAGDWIYYADSGEGGGLFRIGSDGSSRQQLSDERCSQVAVAGEWVYYSSQSENGALYRISSDGSVRQKLGDERCQEIAVTRDWVLYSNAADSNKLYRLSMDGGSRQKLSDDQALYSVVDGDWLYYSNKSDECKLYRIKTDGSDRQKLGEDWTANLVVSGEKVYYTNGYVGQICQITIKT